jgi:hypothetical protein
MGFAFLKRLKNLIESYLVITVAVAVRAALADGTEFTASA